MPHGWGTFKVGSLFDVTRPSASRSVNGYAEGNMPYVASGADNNGVSAYLEPRGDSDVDEGDCITVSPIDGKSFYQPADFLGRGGAGSSIIICRRKDGVMSDGSGNFVASVMSEAFEGWSYDSMGSKDAVENADIKLPVDDFGLPDWEYMAREYIYIASTMTPLAETLFLLAGRNSV